eukprot:182510-Pelagomonas_calceolata.AAC.2
MSLTSSCTHKKTLRVLGRTRSYITSYFFPETDHLISRTIPKLWIIDQSVHINPYTPQERGPVAGTAQPAAVPAAPAVAPACWPAAAAAGQQGTAAGSAAPLPSCHHCAWVTSLQMNVSFTKIVTQLCHAVFKDYD